MTTLRERRRASTAREITRVALRLFGERGFEDVTVDEIVREVGISPRTFFRYFATKDDVVLQYHRRIHERLVDALVARPADEGPVTALRNAYVATSRVAPDERESVLLTNRFLGSSSDLHIRIHGVQAGAGRRITELVAARMGVDPAHDSRPMIVAAAMGAAAGATFGRWVGSEGVDDPGDEVGAALMLLEQGLAGVDGASSTMGRP